MTVAMNMTVVARSENPRRLSNFRESGLAKNKRLYRKKNEHRDNDRCREEYKEHSCY